MGRIALSDVPSTKAGATELPEIAMDWPRLPESVVKSAGRALQILEYFDNTHREATVMDITRALRYPESSTSVLLRSLTEIGYLEYDRKKRTYHPTSRVRLLGSWVDAPLFENDRILDLMETLNRDTGEIVILATRNGLYSQYIHIAQAHCPFAWHLPPGLVRPLVSSASGWALLSHLSDDEISKIIRRANAEAVSPDLIVKLADVMGRIAAIRADGYVLTDSVVTPGMSIIVTPFPEGFSRSPLAICIGGLTAEITADAQHLISMLRERISTTFLTQA